MKSHKQIELIEQWPDGSSMALRVNDSGTDYNRAFLHLQKFDPEGHSVSMSEFELDKDDARILCAYLQSSFNL